MKKALNQKARRVINRVRKILIVNKEQHCYLLDIYFNEKTIKTTTEITRHKYILKALNCLKCDYIAVMNYNKDKTREHYRAIISTQYREFLNHLTYKFFNTKGTIRHQYITSENKTQIKVRKYVSRITELHKNELDKIATKKIIYSDINKSNLLNELQYKIKLNRNNIIYNKKHNKDITELTKERDNLIDQITQEKIKTLKEISHLYNTKKGAKEETALIGIAKDNTEKKSEEKREENFKKYQEEQNLIYLKSREEETRIISSAEYEKLKKTDKDNNLITFYEIANGIKKDIKPFFKNYVLHILEFQKNGITKEQYKNYCLQAKSGKVFNEKEFKEIITFQKMKPYTAKIITKELNIIDMDSLMAENWGRDIDEIAFNYADKKNKSKKKKK